MSRLILLVEISEMTIRIKINDNYCVILDQINWAVCQWQPRENSRAGGIWESTSWHRSLQQAGEYLRLRVLSQEDLDDLDEIINAISHSNDLLSSAIRDSRIPDSWRDAKEKFGNNE